jgi:hypothetical protein
MMQRRAVDKCMAKRVWERTTPYVQILGWLPLFGGAISAIAIAVTFVNDTKASNVRSAADHKKIFKVERKIDHLNDNLVLVMRRLNIKPLPLPGNLDDIKEDDQ